MKSQVVPTRSLIRIRGSASIQEAAQLMCDMSMGALGVDDVEHEFLGLVTERDLMWAAALGKDPIETPVKEIVNDFPIGRRRTHYRGGGRTEDEIWSHPSPHSPRN